MASHQSYTPYKMYNIIISAKKAYKAICYGRIKHRKMVSTYMFWAAPGDLCSCAAGCSKINMMCACLILV